MSNGLASIAARAITQPTSFNPTNEYGGELRAFYSRYTVPAVGGPAVGEIITWGQLPQGARILFGRLTCSAGAASSTLNLGDRVSAARYLAASAVNAAANISIDPPATFALGAAGYAVATPVAQFPNHPLIASDDSELRSTVAGANLAAGQTFNLLLLFIV
jgi:hypothetical protein